MLITTPTTVDAAHTATTVATPGVTVVLLHVPPVPSSLDIALLTDAEQTRAARFAFVRDQSAFVTTRAALRRALSDALACAPKAVAIVSASGGRPALHDSHGSPLDFNVSHSGAVAAIALSYTGRVGVDVEVHDAQRGLRELVPTVMGVNERAMLDALADAASFCEAFYGCWTRKEAIVKGIGTGISADLTAIDVPDVPDDGLVMVPVAAYPQWRVVTVRIRPDMTLSVAVAGCAGPIEITRLSECA